MFIETFRIANGILPDCHYHNLRLHRTRTAHFGALQPWDLVQLVSIPTYAQQGVWKGRLTYAQEVLQLDFEPYTPRLVQTLKLIDCDTIAYGFKYQNRQLLHELFAQRGQADDVLIVKNGILTDTSYANVVFWDGSHWVTPNTPLLEGTKRAELLDKGVIVSAKITAADLVNFSHARLINAMLVFDDTPFIEVKNISNNF